MMASITEPSVFPDPATLLDLDPMDPMELATPDPMDDTASDLQLLLDSVGQQDCLFGWPGDDFADLPMFNQHQDDMKPHPTLEDMWHSDSSDSGIDTTSIKQEPPSPASSQSSYHGDETQMATDSLLRYATHEDPIHQIITGEDDMLSQLSYSQIDSGIPLLPNSLTPTQSPNTTPTYSPTSHTDTATSASYHSPDTPPHTPDDLIHNTSVQAQSHSVLKPSHYSTLNTEKAKSLTFKPQSHQGAAATSSGQIKVVLPQSHGKSLSNLKVNSGKISGGKPLVLTPAEFAKLTAQGVLKLHPPATPSPLVKKDVVTKTQIPLNPSMTSFHSKPASPTGPIICPPDVDLKSWKRQQRMIKNRESASLSRKRKKEYLSKIEQRLHDCTVQGEKLRAENVQLKRKVQQLMKENEQLKQKMSGSTVVRGAGTAMLVVMLLFSFNLSPWFTLQKGDSKAQSWSSAVFHHSSSAANTGRHLLSVDTDADGTDGSTAYYNMTSLERTLTELHRNIERQVVEQRDGDDSNLYQDVFLRKSIEALSNMCPTYSNATDSQRLADQISGWFLGQRKQELKREKSGKLRQKPGHRLDNKQQEDIRDAPVYHPRKVHVSTTERDYIGPYPESSSTELQVVSRVDVGYQALLEALDRRNDTFYVVSFRTDQLLLPAVSNTTQGRPKMSLVLPALGLNGSHPSSPGELTMMRIDCEVTATDVLHIQKSSIPGDIVLDNTTYFDNQSSSKPPSPVPVHFPRDHVNRKRPVRRNNTHKPTKTGAKP